MVLDPIPQSLPVHFFGSRPKPPTSRLTFEPFFCFAFDVWAIVLFFYVNSSLPHDTYKHLHNAHTSIQRTHFYRSFRLVYDVQTCKHTHTYTHFHIEYTPAHTYKFKSTQKCVYSTHTNTHTHVYTQTHTDTHTHEYTHKYTHTHIHTCVRWTHW